jgi:hypothetical protein
MDTQPDPAQPDSEIAMPECPIACPNRKQDGIWLDFGKGKKMHIDPFEMLLYMLLMLPIGTMIKEALADDYTFEKAIGRVTAISAFLWGIRKAPTQDIYEWLLTKSLDKKEG